MHNEPPRPDQANLKNIHSPGATHIQQVLLDRGSYIAPFRTDTDIMNQTLRWHSELMFMFYLGMDFFSRNSYGLDKIYHYIELHPMKNFTIGYYYLTANVDLLFVLTMGQRRPCLVIYP